MSDTAQPDVGPRIPSGTSAPEAAVAAANPGTDLKNLDINAAIAADLGGDDYVEGDGDPVVYEPADNTISDVLDHVEKNPDQRQAVIAAERGGKNRSTLIAQLEA